MSRRGGSASPTLAPRDIRTKPEQLGASGTYFISSLEEVVLVATNDGNGGTEEVNPGPHPREDRHPPPSSALGHPQPRLLYEPESFDIQQIFEDRRFEAQLLELIAQRMDPLPIQDHDNGIDSVHEEFEDGRTEIQPPAYRPRSNDISS
jgi:hypothetical protein